MQPLNKSPQGSRLTDESALNSTIRMNGTDRKPPNHGVNPVLGPSPSPTMPSKRTAEAVNALSVLSPREQKELVECETVIERGWQTFVEVGRALARIRDGKLYRAQYDTFESYCREKWHYGKSHAYRLIGAAEVFTCLSPIGDIPGPTHEAQIRPLMGLEPEKARDAWRKAVEKAKGAMVTAKLVRNAVSEAVGNLLQKPTKSRSKSEQNTLVKRVTIALTLLKQAEVSIIEKHDSKRTLNVLSRLKACLEGIKGQPQFSRNRKPNDLKQGS